MPEDQQNKQSEQISSLVAGTTENTQSITTLQQQDNAQNEQPKPQNELSVQKENKSRFKPFENREFPKAISLKKLIGPSFIILGLGLGSGEIILWPYLASNFGLGIIWGALVGITLQFFMNMEIERYALARGESVFVGFARKFKWAPTWFLLSTFVPWIWPGIAAGSAKLIGHLFGLTETTVLAIVFMVLMGVILTLGPTLYKTVESFQKILISVGVPTIFILSVVLAGRAEFGALAQGIVGIGEFNGGSYNFLPVGIPLATFLAALAYAGAGGNLNLAQSFYVKGKGYGMGKYAGKIKSVLTGKAESFELTGYKFELTDESLQDFRAWWKNVNIEHFVVFWLTGSITILLLALMAYTTTFGLEGTTSDIDFVILESQQIGKMLTPVLGTFFLLVAGLTLFGTQLTVYDATSRILTENVLLFKRGTNEKSNVSSIYYTVLWVQILTGIAILLTGFNQPLQLIITAAVMNAFAMFVHVGMTLFINTKILDKPLQPGTLRKIVMVFAFLFYGGFSLFVLIERLFTS